MPLAYISAAPRLWAVRSLSVLALSASLGLTLWKWTGTGSGPNVPGCGGPDGCGAVLESRWSQWFSVPVTLLAATLWAAVLVLTLPQVQHSLGRTADQLFTAAGALLTAGALWFGGLLVLVVGMPCPWCLALHATGLVVGGFILYSAWQAERTGGRGLLAVAGQAAFAGLALLVVGQVFGTPPDTHMLTSTLPASHPSPNQDFPSRTTRGQEDSAWGPHDHSPEVSYFDGTLTYRLFEQPFIGSARAQHILAEFYDYTCPTCRSLHRELKKLQSTAPGHYAVILLPVPLSRKCNPGLPDTVTGHLEACELATLALAFWRAAPRQFAFFHDYLMTSNPPLTLELARAEARRLAPAVDLSTKELADWSAGRIQANVGVWQRLSQENQKLPKLLLRDGLMMHGTPATGKRFLEIINAAFPSPPSIPAIPVSLPVK
ncbi:MAG: hypothetical protein JWM59_2849 [Verrucomicrobiales bacterium]|nr:hypothetical protein [Verrucomicrobiales bacterium]